METYSVDNVVVGVLKLSSMARMGPSITQVDDTGKQPGKHCIRRKTSVGDREGG